MTKKEFVGVLKKILIRRVNMAMKKILAGSLAAIAFTFAVSAADFAKTKVYEKRIKK